MSIATIEPKVIVYPDSDGQPMAENTKQWRWIVTIQGNIALQEQDNPDCFVAGDNLIYPVEGHPEIRAAPDIYVAFGRPKGDRGSYRVWEEGNIFPQVVFEVLSPGNRAPEMARKFVFYELYGAREYYIYDPDHHQLYGFLYDERTRLLDPVETMHGHISPRLGVRFELEDDEFRMYRRTGERFLSFEEIGMQNRSLMLELEGQRQEADQQQRRAEEAERRNEKLLAKLRSLGVEPDLNGNAH